MAGAARYTALLDACVLYPMPIADVLLSLHCAGFFAARWTKRIDQEWVDALTRQRPELEGKLETRRESMHSAVLDWEVPAAAYEALMPGLELPDRNDTHVFAAAIAGHADCIITVNRKDFPAAILMRHGLEAVHPDDFVLSQISLNEVLALQTFKEMRARLIKRPLDPEQFAEAHEKAGLASFAQYLRDAAALI